MGTFVTSLVAALAHPLCLIGLALAGVLWLSFQSRLRRYDRIVAELVALPAARRRYTLEREHKIFPGRDHAPLNFIRRRRARLQIAAGMIAAVTLGTLIGVAVYQARVASEAVWDLDDRSIVRENHGYAWRIQLANRSSEVIRVEALHVQILRRAPHASTLASTSAIAAQSGDRRRIVTLKPSLETVPILGDEAQFTLAPGQSRPVPLLVNAAHPPNEGWTYELRLEARWHVPGKTASFSRHGTVYRLGWAEVLARTGDISQEEITRTHLADPVQIVAE